MKFKIFIFMVTIFLKKSAAQLTAGECTFPDLDIGLIEKTIKDSETLSVSYSVTGGTISIIPIPTDDETELSSIVNATVKNNTLYVITTAKFTDFESRILKHKAVTLERHYRVYCDEGKYTNLLVRVTIEDVNNHIPTFSFPKYTYYLPKKLSPDLDLTTVINGVPIIVEDLDFSNTDIQFSLQTEYDVFLIESVPLEGSRAFKAILKVTDYTTLNETMTLTIKATDNGNPKKTSTATITVSSPHMVGECTLDDDGKLYYGFYQTFIKDNETLNLKIDYTGPLSLSTSNDEDTGKPYINVDLDEKNKQLVFTTNKNFSNFDYNHRSERTQPILTVYRSVELDCDGTAKTFTFGLGVEDTNNNRPRFLSSSYTYMLSMQLMPKVDLTSLSEPIIVEDDDFSNTGVTFTVDNSAFAMETVAVKDSDNNRKYRGVLRLLQYMNNTDARGISLKVTATDNGEPPLSATVTVTILAEDETA